MAYQEALEAAGATVRWFKQFGSYQGDWWAHVTYNGKQGWVHGYYGSCSGCDAFEAEFGWDDENKADYSERLKKFGESYLDDIMDQDAAIAHAGRNLEWDFDAEEMVAHIKEHGGKT